MSDLETDTRIEAFNKLVRAIAVKELWISERVYRSKGPTWPVAGDSPVVSVNEDERLDAEVEIFTNQWISSEAGFEVIHPSPLRLSDSDDPLRYSDAWLLKLRDVSKFAKFLKDIPKSSLSQEFVEHVLDLVDCSLQLLHTKVLETYYASAPESGHTPYEISEDFHTHYEDFINNIDALAASLRHIGAKKTPQHRKLLVISQHAKDGLLEEYVRADELGLFDPVGEPPMTRNFFFTTASEIAEVWASVTTLIRDLDGKPNSDRLSAQLGRRALAHFDYQKEYWAQSPDWMQEEPNFVGWNDVFITTEMEFFDLGLIRNNSLDLGLS
jgi:hypothetical protein